LREAKTFRVETDRSSFDGLSQQVRLLKSQNRDLSAKLRIKDRNTSFLQPELASSVVTPKPRQRLQKLVGDAAERMKDLERQLNRERAQYKVAMLDCQ